MPPNITTLPLWSLLCKVGGGEPGIHSLLHSLIQMNINYMYSKSYLFSFSFLFCYGSLLSISVSGLFEELC